VTVGGALPPRDTAAGRPEGGRLSFGGPSAPAAAAETPGAAPAPPGLGTWRPRTGAGDLEDDSDDDDHHSTGAPSRATGFVPAAPPAARPSLGPASDYMEASFATVSTDEADSLAALATAAAPAPRQPSPLRRSVPPPRRDEPSEDWDLVESLDLAE